MTTERVGPGPVNRFFQKVNNIAVGWPMMLIFNMRHFNVPKLDGPYILAPNHTSYLDPCVIQLLYRRHITFLMDKAIYHSPWLNWFFRFWGALPVSEGGVTPSAIKNSLRIVRAGGVVGIFPEGRIAPDGVLQAGMPGVSMLMMKARVPVVPVAIVGTHKVLPKRARFLRRGRIHIHFGEPIMPEETAPKGKDARKEAEKRLTDRVMTGIEELLRRNGGNALVPARDD